MRREVQAGFALGIVLAMIGVVRILMWHALSGAYEQYAVDFAVTIGVSLVGVVLWGSLSGALLPFVLRASGLDPASASAIRRHAAGRKWFDYLLRCCRHYPARHITLSTIAYTFAHACRHNQPAGTHTVSYVRKCLRTHSSALSDVAPFK